MSTIVLDIGLLAASTFMLGIGFIFTWIDFRTPMGLQFRYFATQLLIFPLVTIVYQLSVFPGLSAKAYLLLTQALHCVSIVFIVNAIYFMSTITGKTRIPIFKVFLVLSLICLPLVFTPWMIYSDPDSVAKAPGGPLYLFFFMPYFLSFVLTMYFYLVRHLRQSLPGQKNFQSFT